MSQPPLSDEELTRLRSIIAHDKHLEWFWAVLRKWGGWVAGGLAAILAFREDLRAIFTFLFRGGP